MQVFEIVQTHDGSKTLFDPETQECYHARAGALSEAQKLYVEATGYSQVLNQPQAWPASAEGPGKPPSAITAIYVLDVGLGLAYNAMATLEAWWHASHPPDLVMVSLENNRDLLTAYEQAPWATEWPARWRDTSRELASTGKVVTRHPLGLSTASWTLLEGDARRTLAAYARSSTPSWAWSYIWQDPFSPTKNPTLWECDWFDLLASQSDSRTVLATYSVARCVRDALSAAHWSWSKIPSAIGSKRSWLLARLS